MYLHLILCVVQKLSSELLSTYVHTVRAHFSLILNASIDQRSTVVMQHETNTISTNANANANARSCEWVAIMEGCNDGTLQCCRRTNYLE